MSKTTAILPKMSEKAYAQSQARTYVFTVPVDANKHTVARAVAAQFDVKVEAVNLLVQKGKAKRTITQKGRRVFQGRTNRVKKAYVTVAEGQHLPIFDAMEAEEAKADETQAKLDKAAAKQAEKAAKKESK
jgi:large subunit ribosomal protein L23